MNNIYIGYDSRLEDVYNVCKYSILKNSNVNVIPLNQTELRNKKIYNRPNDILGSTEFTITRFLVPYLSNYKGWSLFCDCDFLWTVNINELFDLCDSKYKVMVVKHDYIPKTLIKMDNQIQHKFPRKNWSSLMLFNNEKCQNLNLKTINESSSSYLHQMRWASDEEIGSLPVEYNCLVGYYELDNPKGIHYTDGGPWFKNYENVQYADLWKKEYELYRKSL